MTVAKISPAKTSGASAPKPRAAKSRAATPAPEPVPADALVLDSTAPHLYGASDWDADCLDWGPHQAPVDGRSLNRGRLLVKGEDGLPEAGIWRATPGTWKPILPADELCHFTRGRARYVSEAGEAIEIAPGTVVHFKEGWRGTAEIFEEIFVTYMFCEGGPSAATPVLRDPAAIGPLEPWGPVEAPLAGLSQTAGIVLSGEAGGGADSGVWECTPGTWACHVTRDEFCHFLSGRATYTHEGGEVIEIRPDTVAVFPRGWRGTCAVHETVRKIYLIR